MKESKKEFENLSSMIIKIIKNLNDEQYEKLINGEAQLKYIEPQVSQETIYTQVWGELKKQNSYEEKRKLLASKKYNLSTVKELLEFVKYHKIKVPTKSNKSQIIECIIMTAEDTHLNTSNDEVVTLAKALETTTTIDDAWQLYNATTFKKTKPNLKKLATELNVVLNSRLKVAEIPDKIIKTVVQSKINSEIIRKGH